MFSRHEKLTKPDVSLEVFSCTNLGGKRVEGVLLLDEEPRDFRHVLETEDVLQDDEQVAVRHHEGRGQHGVTPAVPHHPQYARPHEEDERQPADVCDAPRLRTTGATQEVTVGIAEVQQD